MKAITLRWREICDHAVTVYVPDDFELDAEYADEIADDVATLQDSGYEGCVRDLFEFEPAQYVSVDTETLYGYNSVSGRGENHG